MILLRELPLNSDTVLRAEISNKGHDRDGGNIRFFPLEVTEEGIRFSYEGETFLYKYTFSAAYEDCEEYIHFELDQDDGELHIYCDLFNSCTMPYFEFENRYSKGKLFRAMATLTNYDPMYLYLELTIKPEQGLGSSSIYKKCFETKYGLKYDIPTYSKLGFKRSNSIKYNFDIKWRSSSEKNYISSIDIDRPVGNDCQIINFSLKLASVKDLTYLFDDRDISIFCEKFLYTLRQLVANSKENYFIYRKEWMISYILKCLVASLNKNTCSRKEDCLANMKALYAVIALLHIECKSEDAPTNPLIEEPSTAFKEGNYINTLENLKAIAEVTIMNINATPHKINCNPDDYMKLLIATPTENDKNSTVSNVSSFGD